MPSHILLATEPNDGEPEAEELLKSLISGFPLEGLLRDLATVSAMIAQSFDTKGYTVESQLEILRRCSKGLQNEDELVQRLRAGEYTAATDENQIANLAMYAVAKKDYAGLARPGSLLRILALFNKLSLQDPATGKYFVAPDSIQGTFSVANTYRERAHNVAYRYRRFMEWSDARGDDKVRAVFRAAKGMDYEEYAEVVVHLDEYFWENFAKTGVRTLPETSIRDPLVLAYLKQHSVTTEDIDKFLDSDPMRKLRDEGFHQAIEHPFLKYKNEYYLLHPRALENALGAGVFYAALAPGEQQNYFAYVGQFFQDYIGEILQRIAKTGGYAYSGEVKFVRSKDGKSVDSSDHFLFRDGALMFFEDRYARISKPLLRTLDPDKIESALREAIFSKLHQLNWNMESYLSGDFDIPGVKRSDVRAIYPILVLPHSLPRSPAVQQRIDQEISDKGYLQGVRDGTEVKPFEIAEAEALEGLAGLAQAPSIAKMLDRKFAGKDSRADFFKNHLILNEGLQLRIWSDEEMRAWYRDLEQRRQTRLEATK